MNAADQMQPQQYQADGVPPQAPQTNAWQGGWQGKGQGQANSWRGNNTWQGQGQSAWRGGWQGNNTWHGAKGGHNAGWQQSWHGGGQRWGW